jgi:purine-binding chemotaxis protein CheW
VRTLQRLQGELAETEAALLSLGADELPGIHLVVEVSGHLAALPGGRVRMVVPLLATQPVPEAPPEVLGTFVLRGALVTVLDLARRLGIQREPSLDAAIVVLGGARATGVLVDRVLAIEERLELLQGGGGEDEGPWTGTRLVAGLCRWNGRILPILHVGALVGPLVEAA